MGWRWVEWVGWVGSARGGAAVGVGGVGSLGRMGSELGAWSWRVMVEGWSAWVFRYFQGC